MLPNHNKTQTQYQQQTYAKNINHVKELVQGWVAFLRLPTKVPKNGRYTT